MSPKLSIVIPTYNAGASIRRCLESIAKQDYANFELILADGGSQDQTVKTAREYSHLFSHIISEADGGQANGLNKGFQKATGDILAWLCADDAYEPGALQHVADCFARFPEAEIVSGGCRRIFDDSTILETKVGADVWERISYINGIEQPSTFWRRSLHAKVFPLDESYHFAFDWHLWNKMKVAGAHLQPTEKILSTYYFSEDNKTSQGGTPLVQEMYKVMKTYGPLKGWLADIWLFLYKHYDLKGCYDRPPICDAKTSRHFALCIRLLKRIFGKELIYSYNWNFASKQQRKLCWHK